MSPSPRFRFLASSFLGEIPIADLDPTLEIPLQRPGTGTAAGFPLRQYFEAIRGVIEKDGFHCLRKALGARLGRGVRPEDLRELLIYSEKHGGDYHPAKIEVRLPEQIVFFAMNVALNERGRSVVSNEYGVLDELKGRFGHPFLPANYFLAEIETLLPTGEKVPLAMYLAEWLEGFYEFHLSLDPADGKQKMVLWDTARHDHYLTGTAVEQIYREMARILTLYYDVKKFAQIYPWHLAAGDFIARIAGDGVEVRLVAARRYGPLIGPPDLPPEEALLFFFLHLTLRLRVDRLDGVGEVSWAGSDCLGAMAQGFLLALREKRDRREISSGFLTGFRTFLASRTSEDFEERLTALADSGTPDPAEESWMKKKLSSHSKQLINIMATL